MALLDFPSSPTTGQQYTGGNGVTYTYDGALWAVQGMGQAVFIGPAAPANPPTGNMWWRSDPDQNLYIYYDDGNSKQWVNAVPTVSNPVGPAGGDLSGTYPNPVLKTVGAVVLRSTDLVLTTGAVTTIPFDTVSQNRGSCWAAGTPTQLFMTSPGNYLAYIGATFFNTNATGARTLQIVGNKGTTVLARVDPLLSASNIWMSAVVSTIYQCTDPTDYIQFQAQQSSGANLNLVGNQIRAYIWRLSN